MGLLDQWNKNKFSIYRSEEKTVLKLLEEIGKWLEKTITILDKKTDLYGDHKGTWQGISRPTLSEEGLRGTVEKHIEDIKKINNKIDDDILKPNILTGEIGGTITLERNKTYIVENNLTIKENSKIDGKWATIKFDGVINIKDNVEIYNVNFVTNTSILRDERGVCLSNHNITLSCENTHGVNIHNCTGDGVIVSFNNSTNFNVSDNNFKGGATVGGIVEGFSSTNGTILNNELQGCKVNGIGLHTCDNITVENNKCHNNGHSGIWTPYSTNLKIYKNVMYNHEIYDGIDANFGADTHKHNFKSNSEIIGNICFNNGATGIYLCGSHCKIENNHCYENGTNGIRIYKWRSEGDTTKSNFNSIIGNVVYNNNKLNNPQGSSLTHNLCFTDVQDSIIKDNIVYLDDVNITTLETNLYLVGDNNFIADNTMVYLLPSLVNNESISINGQNNRNFNNRTSYNSNKISNENELGRLTINGNLTENVELLNIIKKESTPDYANAINLNNGAITMSYQGDISLKRNLQMELGDINWFGPLPKGAIKIGYENNEDGNYWLVIGTSKGNKKVLLT